MQWRRCLMGVVLVLAATGVRADLPPGLVLDHGYTWFDIKGEVDYRDGSPVDLGWTLQPGFRIVGDTPDHSAFHYTIRDGRKVLAEKRADGNRAMGMMGRKEYPTNPVAIANLALYPGSVQGKSPVVTGEGEFAVDVSYIDGATGKEYPMHTYTITVGKVAKVRGPATLPQVDAPEYFVSRHQEALTSILTGMNSYVNRSGQGGQLEKVARQGGKYALYWNVSPHEYSWSGPSLDAHLACTVNGETLVWGNPNDPNFAAMSAAGSLDNISVKTEKKLQVVHSDRNSLDYRRGNPYREYLTWHLMRISLPIGLEAYGPNTGLMEHAGKWECRLMDNGELLRTFRWTVNADGSLKPHEEQQQGLTLAPDTILVETVIPEKGASFDGRLVPEAVEAGGFYGWEWESDSMEDLAEDVPEIGKPWPVPSAPTLQKAPEKEDTSSADRAAEEAAAAARDAEKAAAEERRQAEAREQEAAQAARMEAREQEREAAFAEARDKALADANAAIREATEGVENASREAADAAAGQGAFGGLMRLLLGLVLVALGLTLNGAQVAAMVAPLAGAISALSGNAKIVGFAGIGLAVLDFLLDLVNLRPLAGDGLPQLAALAGGAVAAREALTGMEALKGQAARLETLGGMASLLGWACLALGVIHLVAGGVAFL
ncbi:MAG: hypothetical protein H6993_07185 [Pseudomonadales bacterium]|nr:hypothetical protein [Pseudomonadales bacterium]